MGSIDHLSADVQAALERDLTIDITTIGRRTGKARRIEIWFITVDGALVIMGTPGERDWFANLSANPEFTFHLKESVAADLEATATVISDIDERRKVIESDAARWYRQQGDNIEDLIAFAPMVWVTLR